MRVQSRLRSGIEEALKNESNLFGNKAKVGGNRSMQKKILDFLHVAIQMTSSKVF